MIQESKSNIDIEVIKQIYLDANAFNNNLNKKFEEVLNFHNKMVENRSRFVEKQFEKVNMKLKELKYKQEELLEKKRIKVLNC